MESDLLFSLATTLAAHWSERFPFLGWFVHWCREEAPPVWPYLRWLEGHSGWSFSDDGCWSSRCGSRLQWSVADTWAWTAVSILGEHAANSPAPCCALAKSCRWVEQTSEHNMLLFHSLKMCTTVNLAVWHQTLRNWDFAIPENKQHYY